eukprot:3605303-Alexandrium_andersonii.AAC.1
MPQPRLPSGRNASWPGGRGGAYSSAAGPVTTSSQGAGRLQGTACAALGTGQTSVCLHGLRRGHTSPWPPPHNEGGNQP